MMTPIAISPGLRPAVAARIDAASRSCGAVVVCVMSWAAVASVHRTMAMMTVRYLPGRLLVP